MLSYRFTAIWILDLNFSSDCSSTRWWSRSEKVRWCPITLGQHFSSHTVTTRPLNHPVVHRFLASTPSMYPPHVTTMQLVQFDFIFRELPTTAVCSPQILSDLIVTIRYSPPLSGTSCFIRAAWTLPRGRTRRQDACHLDGHPCGTSRTCDANNLHSGNLQL